MGKAWMSFNRRLSGFFTGKLGLLTDERSGIVKGVEYFPARLREVIALCQKRFPNEPLRVLDVGCGRYTYLQTLEGLNPSLLSYGMDVSDKELNNNTFPIKHIIHDTCSKHYRDGLKEYEGFFHLVISHSFLEHVPNAEVTHSMIHFLLKPEGLALHAYPTLYDPLLFIGNLFPVKCIEKLVLLFEPWRRPSGKFRTYYDKCRCDSKRLRGWFDSLGYGCIEYRDFYGTGYCYALFPLQWIMDLFYWLVIKLNIRLFTAHAVVTLEKKK